MVHTGEGHLLNVHTEEEHLFVHSEEKHLLVGERQGHLAKIVEGGGLLELLLNTSCCHLFQPAVGNSKTKVAGNSKTKVAGNSKTKATTLKKKTRKMCPSSIYFLW